MDENSFAASMEGVTNADKIVKGECNPSRKIRVRALTTEESYFEALAEMSRLIAMDPEVESPEGRRLIDLKAVVESYEAEHYPMT